jgi:hypothetical protein
MQKDIFGVNGLTTSKEGSSPVLEQQHLDHWDAREQTDQNQKDGLVNNFQLTNFLKFLWNWGKDILKRKES